MCGGASKILVGNLHLPQDMEFRLKTLGLITAQDILDEGRPGLRVAGMAEDDITILSESIHKEVGQRID